MRKPQRLVPYSENKGYASNLRRFPPNVLLDLVFPSCVSYPYLVLFLVSFSLIIILCICVPPNFLVMSCI